MPEEVHAKPFRFEIERKGDAVVVKCHGRLVAGATESFQDDVKQLFAEAKELTIDLAGVTYVDSTGVGLLVRLYVSARQAGCEWKLLHLGKQVRNLLKLTNLTATLGVAEEHGITIA